MFFSLKDCYKNVCDALRLILIITNLPRIWFADAVVLLAHSEGKIIIPGMCGDKNFIQDFFCVLHCAAIKRLYVCKSKLNLYAAISIDISPMRSFIF